MKALIRTRTLSLVLALAVILSGCAGTLGGESPDTETTGTVTTVEETTMTQITETTEEQTPKKGSNLFSVTQINESNAMEYNASSRSDFENLTDEQHKVFKRALECDCNVNQEVFRFNDKDRIQVVKYDGNYYYLRVTVV